MDRDEENAGLWGKPGSSAFWVQTLGSVDRVSVSYGQNMSEPNRGEQGLNGKEGHRIAQRGHIMALPLLVLLTASHVK